MRLIKHFDLDVSAGVVAPVTRIIWYCVSYS